MTEIALDNKCCKGCDICIAICPKQVFVKSKKRNAMGTSIPEVTRIDQCTLCKLCEKMCPDGAISVERGTK
jgi:2-oxoglutarate ferredoxin oxidoreductase subunit delta